jgi:hypothetical protein
MMQVVSIYLFVHLCVFYCRLQQQVQQQQELLQLLHNQQPGSSSSSSSSREAWWRWLWRGSGGTNAEGRQALLDAVEQWQQQQQQQRQQPATRVVQQVGLGVAIKVVHVLYCKYCM